MRISLITKLFGNKILGMVQVRGLFFRSCNFLVLHVSLRFGMLQQRLDSCMMLFHLTLLLVQQNNNRIVTYNYIVATKLLLFHYPYHNLILCVTCAITQQLSLIFIQRCICQKTNGGVGCQVAPQRWPNKREDMHVFLFFPF